MNQISNRKVEISVKNEEIQKNSQLENNKNNNSKISGKIKFGIFIF